MWDEPGGDLLERCRGGDPEALEELLVLITPLVRWVAGRLSRGGGPFFEDLLQEGFLSILRALPKYDGSRGKFTSFAFSCARNGMVSFLRREKTRQRGRGALEPVVEGVNAAWPLFIVEEDLLEGLSVMEMAVLDAFLQAGSVSSAAALLGWSRKRTDNALQRARKKLRESLSGDRR